jgi:hypothetical protein
MNAQIGLIKLVCIGLNNIFKGELILTKRWASLKIQILLKKAQYTVDDFHNKAINRGLLGNGIPSLS